MDDVNDQMFVVKEFQAHATILETQGDPAAPRIQMVRLQVLSEVGSSSNLMGSPQMFLSPELARQLGQRLLHEAKVAMDAVRESTEKKRH